MKITLLTEKEYQDILNISNAYDSFHLQNKGYECIDRESFSSSEKEAFKSLENILRNHITGFSSFSNFRKDRNNNLQLRFQYDYSYEGNGVPFIGVGYILLNELLNGFNK